MRESTGGCTGDRQRNFYSFQGVDEGNLQGRAPETSAPSSIFFIMNL